MNAEQIHQKILFGYYKAAAKLGAYFNLYRSATPITPIQIGNLIGGIRMTQNTSWDYMKGSSYGKSQYNACIDARSSNSPYSARVGDYLVPATDPDSGIIDNNTTYFLQQLEFDQPPQVIECNNSISIMRPAQTSGAGNVGYVGYTAATSTAVMTTMPASVLLESRGENAATKLPTDTREPTWIILIPNLGNVTVRIGDIVIDNTNQNYVIYNNELTDLGWRIRAMQVVNYK